MLIIYPYAIQGTKFAATVKSLAASKSASEAWVSMGVMGTSGNAICCLLVFVGTSVFFLNVYFCQIAMLWFSQSSI